MSGSEWESVCEWRVLEEYLGLCLLVVHVEVCLKDYDLVCVILHEGKSSALEHVSSHLRTQGFHVYAVPGTQ